MQDIKIVEASIPLQLITVRIFPDEGLEHVFLRDERLRMRADNHVKVCFQKAINDF